MKTEKKRHSEQSKESWFSFEEILRSLSLPQNDGLLGEAIFFKIFEGSPWKPEKIKNFAVSAIL